MQIDPAYKIAVYATQPLGGARIREVAATTLNGLNKIEDLFVLIMLHPYERKELYQQLAAGNERCRVFAFGEVSLYDALNAADLFVTSFSTAALEAMMFNVPVVTVEPFLSISMAKGRFLLPALQRNWLFCSAVLRKRNSARGVEKPAFLKILCN